MSERKKRIPSLGAQIAAYVKPIMAGKIDAQSLGYRYSGDGYTNPQGVHFKAFADDRGDLVSLSRPRAVRCPDVDRYPTVPLVNGSASVPLSTCKRCPMRLDRGCCSILRAKARGEA